MEQLFENKKLNVSVRTVEDKGQVFLCAKDVAGSLGYKQPRNAIRDHVWNENKVILDDLTTRTDSVRQWNFKPNTIFLTEAGVYQLIFKSNLPSAREFQRWVFNEVLPSIRKTGSYELPEPKPLDGNQLKLLNETDLHYAIIRYIRNYHPDALVIAGLGEHQDTVQRRSDAYHKGYLGGQPDILIVNPMNGYNGFAIELKTPKGTGVIRENQVGWLGRLTQLGYKTTFSNDYTDLVLKIHEYFRVDLTVKHKKETANLKRQCNILKQKPSEATACYRPWFTAYKY
jgi:prophage antirepressor-like protein